MYNRVYKFVTMVINFLNLRDQFAGPNGVVFFLLEDGDRGLVSET